jgi:ectoine hydroxylase-related dioxygenase (phytanoyl-CoA dioxygenase family)
VGDHRLTAAELEQLDRDGYVVRESVFEPHEVREIVERCEALVTRVAAGRNGTRYHVGSYTFDPDQLTGVTIKWEGDTDAVHGLEPFCHLAPELEELAADRRLVDPMIAFVGDEEPALFTEKLNLKRPHVGGPNPLHQDHPYWSFAPARDRTATVMIFLDDASVENGTLHVVPGSQRLGPWKNRTDRDVFGNLEIDPALDVEGAAVPVEVPAGSIACFGSLLVHKSAPNTSDRHRRSLLYSYQPSGLPHAREHFKAASTRRTDP